MSIFNKLTKGVADAGNKAKLTIETTKLKGQISKNNEEILKYYQAIGQEVYKLHNAQQITLNDELASKVTSINELLATNANIEKDIKVIWNEKDCTCGQIVSLDTKFCPTCGYHFPEQAPLIHELEDATVVLGSDSPNETKNNLICSHCDADLAPEAKFCGACGTVIE